MKVHWALDGKVAILRPHGDLKGGEETDRLEAAAQRLAAQGNCMLLIDLCDVSFMSSPVFKAFERLKALYEDPGGTIKVCNLTKRVRTIIEIAKVCFLFDPYDSEREALAAFAEGLEAASTPGNCASEARGESETGEDAPAAPTAALPQ